MRPIPPSKKKECIRLRVEKNLSTPRIARAVGISNYSVYRILQKYPWRPDYGYGRRHWSEGDSNRLRLLYPLSTHAALAEAFPNRTAAAIQKHANELGLRRDSRTFRKNQHYISPVVEALRSERLRARRTGQQVADKMGYHIQQIRSWENGTTPPGLRQLEDWADALGMTLLVQPKRIEATANPVAPPSKARLMAGR